MKQKIIDQIRNAKLLAGKMLDSLDESQKQSVSEWEAIEGNQKIQSDIYDEKAFAEWNKTVDDIDTEESWKVFLSAMDKSNAKTKKTFRLTWYKSVASIAAVLVISFSLYFIFQNVGEIEHYQSVAEVNIQPGNAHAQLVLNSGEVVELGKFDKDSIGEGEMSIKNKQGVLEYNHLSTGNLIKPVVNTLKIPRGGEYQLVLPDGTKVWLNSDTELEYTVPFAGDLRKVKLKGEAYFEVAHNKQKPFIVYTEHETIEVIGTEFVISAYSEDLNVVTTLVNGKVKVSNVNSKGEKVTAYLLPEDQMIFNKETNVVSKNKVDTYLFTSWKDGRFSFSNEPLESLLKKIARWYNVEAYITDESVRKIKFSGDLPRYNNMKNILRILEAEMSVHIDVEDNKIIYVSK